MKKSNITVNKDIIPIATVIIAVVFFSIVACIFGIFNKTSDYVKTEGRVVKTHTEITYDDKNTITKSYYVNIEFKANGKYYEVTQGYAFRHPKKGDIVTIYYNPDNPNELRQQMLPLYVELWFVIIIIILFIYALCRGNIVSNEEYNSKYNK